MVMPKPLKNAIESALHSSNASSGHECRIWSKASKLSSIGRPLGPLGPYCSTTSSPARPVSPHTPSHPTASSAGILWPVTKRSSRTICSAVKSCEKTTSRSPSRTVEKLEGAEPSPLGASALCKEQLPTTRAPEKTNVMPSHWCTAVARRSMTLDMRPVKITTEPRSIWYVEALVIVSPMYIVLVPMMSHHAGIAKPRSTCRGGHRTRLPRHLMLPR
mmetsp:Transcript_7382/g.17319  ORF Transcript_7382/g.17319 Transcript_7382/m.17319 type:complete len:217 (-) Transcript_7382:293-943(-)